MSTAEVNKIKLNLISWINQLSDEYVITFLDGLKHSDSKKDWWEELSENQKKIIISGFKEADNDKTISSKDFWKSLKNA